MARSVKKRTLEKRTAKKRTYSSPLRQEQAARTRARILEAAGTLFESDGYARTTMRAIADRAGVAADTVYAVFGSKARVLTALIDRRLAPDGRTDNVFDDPRGHAIRAEPDPRRPVYEIMRTASAAEEEMAAVYAEMDGQRLRNMRRVAGWIASHGPLRVPVDRAAEIMWAVASPDVARMLCDLRGWTDEEYVEWLDGQLATALLRQ
jgi:AcrR family transcriptional regulator